MRKPWCKSRGCVVTRHTDAMLVMENVKVDVPSLTPRFPLASVGNVLWKARGLHWDGAAHIDAYRENFPPFDLNERTLVDASQGADLEVRT